MAFAAYAEPRPEDIPPVTEMLDSPISAAVEPVATDMIAVLDFGSQYSQLITRRVRDAGVFSELFPHDTPWAEIAKRNPRGIILSGGPASVYDAGAPQLPDWVLTCGLPVLGICYGMQLIAHALGGSVEPAERREYGPAQLHVIAGVQSPLFANLPDTLDVWMSHGDHVTRMPDGFHRAWREHKRALCRDCQRIDTWRSSSIRKSRTHPLAKSSSTTS